MKVQNVRRWAPSGPRGWLAATVALATASAVRELLHPFLGSASPGYMFCIAAALVEFYFGLAPALVTMVIGLGIADVLFVPPYLNISVFDHNDLILFLTYPAITLLIIGLIERLRRAQYHSALIASVARSRYEILLRADNERLLARRDADETHRLLRVLTQRHDQLVFIKAVDPTGATETSDATRDSVANAAAANTNTDTDTDTDAASTTAADQVAPLAPNATTQPGNRFGDVHADDLERVLAMPTPGNHRVRLRAGNGEYRPTDAICERFATPTGLFFVLRLDS